MKHETTIELKPFSTPNYVLIAPKLGRRQDGFDHAPAIPLSDLSVETLDSLCTQFRADVFAKAGKADVKEGKGR